MSENLASVSLYPEVIIVYRAALFSIAIRIVTDYFWVEEH